MRQNKRRPIPGNKKTEIGGQVIKDRVADYDAEGTDTLNDDDNKKKDQNAD